MIKLTLSHYCFQKAEDVKTEIKDVKMLTMYFVFSGVWRKWCGLYNIKFFLSLHAMPFCNTCHPQISVPLISFEQIDLRFIASLAVKLFCFLFLSLLA